MGDINAYEPFEWNQKKVELLAEDLYSDRADVKGRGNHKGKFLNNTTFVDCPKFKVVHLITTRDNKIFSFPTVNNSNLNFVFQSKEYPAIGIEKFWELTGKNQIRSEVWRSGDELNFQCVKNHKIAYFILKNFTFLEKILLKAVEQNSVGFAKIKNPYTKGEVSISRTARYYPANLIFKIFIILSAIFLFFYWLQNLNLFKYLKNKNLINNFPKTFFYFGALSTIFLAMHASFLGLDFDSKLFDKLRNIIIILFIIFEICAQFFLTKLLLKFKKNLNENLNLIILKIKIIFVSIMVFASLIIFSILIWRDITDATKHILEWNYFSILLMYYILSSVMWKLKP